MRKMAKSISKKSHRDDDIGDSSNSSSEAEIGDNLIEKSGKNLEKVKKSQKKYPEKWNDAFDANSFSHLCID